MIYSNLLKKQEILFFFIAYDISLQIRSVTYAEICGIPSIRQER